MENGKTEAGVEENVSLPSSPLDPVEKGETGRREDEANGWRSRERYRREEEAKKRDTLGDAKGKRGRTGGTTRQVYPGPASFSALV